MIALDSGDKIRGDAAAATEVDYLIFGFVGTVATQIADGQLPAAIGDLYTAGAGGIGISSIVLVNTGAVARAVNLYLTPSGGTARRLVPKNYSLAAGYALHTDGKSVHNFPTGAATETTLASALTALQLIDDLRAALGSVNTDDLQVDVKTYPGSNALGNFPFGYYDRYLEAEGDTNTPAGTVTKVLSTVPAGEVWVLQGINGLNANTNTKISLRVSDGTTDFILFEATPSAANTWVFWTGSVVMKAGDYVRVMFTGCTLNDDTYWRAIGYKMKVA